LKKFAIIGRPNVGKSTLFNKLLGKQARNKAITNDIAGVTRDRLEAIAEFGNDKFIIIDTAGLEEYDHSDKKSLSNFMVKQTEDAVKDADILLFCIDARAGITPTDEQFALWARKQNKPVVLLANKCEGRMSLSNLPELYSLGLERIVCISAEHGEGLGDLYDEIIKELPKAPKTDDWGLAPEGSIEEESANSKAINIAMLGRPNVGKSTLINKLLGQERVITSPIAGTTRDAIAIDWQYDGKDIKLYDTAGVRRKNNITEELEWQSVEATNEAIRFAHVVIMVVDGTQALERQDLRLASMAIEEGRAIVLAINKWDLVKNKEAFIKDIDYKLQQVLPQVKGVPVVQISALNGRNLDKLMQAISKAYELWNFEVSTSQLNKWLENILQYNPPPLVRGKRVKLRYMTQTKTRPPTFQIFTSHVKAIADSYVRFLKNDMRKNFDLPGVPIRLIMRKKDNPYI